jgi:NCS1 family nucleobase:cation symporter-1
MSNDTQGVEQSGWPLTIHDRHWTQWQLFVVLVVAACATWCYIIGEYVGYYLNMRMGFAAMTAGSMIGMLLVTLAVVPVATRYGVDSIASATPQFGNRGWIITVFLQYASIIGWNSLLLIFFGKSVAQLLATLGITTADSDRHRHSPFHGGCLYHRLSGAAQRGHRPRAGLEDSLLFHRRDRCLDDVATLDAPS